MPYLPVSTVLGKVKVSHILEYYDIPRLFTCFSEYGKRYLSLSVAEDRSSVTWLYAPISKKREEAIYSGELDLRSAFLDVEGGYLFKIGTYAKGQDTAVTLFPQDVPKSWLPARGEKLSPDERPAGTAAKDVGSKRDLSLPGLEKAVVPTIDYLRKAFEKARETWSSDRVIADPVLDRKFLGCCRELGLSGSDYALNMALMNARKAGKLKAGKTTRFNLDPAVDDRFHHACELAIRYFKLTKGVTVDQILCEPKLAAQFDEYASCLAPGFTALEYRWTALRIRKSGSLPADKDLPLPEFKIVDHVKNLRISKVPDVAGFYLFSSNDHPVFINQTCNLQSRLAQHMKYSDSLGLPQWLWQEPLQVSFNPRPELPLGARKALELAKVREQKPLFNWFASVA